MDEEKKLDTKSSIETNHKRNRIRDFFIYGGVSKEEFTNGKFLMRKQNIKVWRMASLVITALSIFLLLGTFLFESFKPLMVAYSLMTGFSIISCILFFFAFTDENKAIEIYVYFAMLVYLALFIYISIFVSPGNNIAPLAVAIVLIALLDVNYPLNMLIVYVPALVSFIILQVTCKGDSPALTTNILSISLFTIIGFITSLGVKYVRVPSIVSMLHIAKERDTDALTGVYNSIAYERNIKLINQKIHKDESARIALAIFDINNLKQMNDSHGHQAGDILINKCVSIIKEAFKTSNIYRIGGDEFAVIITGSDYDNKESITRILHEKLNSLNDQHNGSSSDISMAFGIATYSKKLDNDYVSLFSRADADMYENKKFLKKKLEK